METETPARTRNAEHFEVIMPRPIFDALEAWRHTQGWKRSKSICTAVLKLTGQPIPLRNRRPLGFLCLACGQDWPLSQPTPPTHTTRGTYGHQPCNGKIAVVVE